MDNNKKRKRSNEKINLKDIYTEKEINVLKETFPNIIPLISSDTNIKFNKTSFDNNINQYIDKNFLIEIIVKALKLSLNKKNNQILSKLISFAGDEIHSIIGNPERNGKSMIESKSAKDSYTFISRNKKYMNYKKKIRSDLLKINTDRNIFLNKNHNNDYYSCEYFPLTCNNNKFNSTKNIKKNKNYHNHSINLMPNSIYNIYKKNLLRNMKDNAIVNNFITFEKINQKCITPRAKNSLNEILPLRLENKGQKYKLNKELIKQIKQSNISPTTHIKIDLNSLYQGKLKNNHNHNSKNINNFSINQKKNSKKENEKSFQLSHRNILYNKKIPKTVRTVNINLISNENIESKKFNIFQFDNDVGKENTLLSIGNHIYNNFSFSFLIDSDKFNNWCKKITAGYSRKIPYHTDLHAADITQTCFIYFIYGKINNIFKLNIISKCSLFLSCICHDFKHPGLNNNFLKEIKHELATRYNDNSILENMHIAETFKLINDNKECNIFSDIDSDKYKQIRKEMISCVLSTDMFYHSKHNEFMDKLIENKNNIENNVNNNNDTNNNNNNEENQNYLNLMIHSADISNPTKPFDIYINWGKLIFEEFSQIGDKEKALGIKCSFDREKMTLEKSQIPFIDYVIEPFISKYIQIFPKLEFLNDNLINNRKKLENKNERKK